MDKKQKLKNRLLNLGNDLAHAETEDQCQEIDMKAISLINEFEQSQETGQVDAIVTLLHEEAMSIEDRNIDNYKPSNVHEFHTQIDTARCLRVAANYLSGNQAG